MISQVSFIPAILGGDIFSSAFIKRKYCDKENGILCYIEREYTIAENHLMLTSEHLVEEIEKKQDGLLVYCDKEWSLHRHNQTSKPY